MSRQDLVGPQRLILPVVRRDDGYIESSESLALGIDDVASESDLKFLSECVERHASVQLNGKVFTTRVFTLPDEHECAYVVTDLLRRPIDNPETTVPVVNNDYSLYLDRLHDRTSNSDVLSVDQALNLATSFVEPRFVESAWFKVRYSHPDSVESSLSWLSARSFSRLVLLGPPGAGKTSALRRLAVEWCERQSPTSYIPIYMQLRDYSEDSSDQRSVEQLAVRSLGQSGRDEFQRLAESGRLLLLIDGFDEIKHSQRVLISEQLNSLAAAHTRLGIVVTCRDYVYEGEFPGFLTLSLLPFSDPQIDQWVAQNISDPPAVELFLTSLKNEPELSQLCRSPLFLSMTVLLFRRYGLLPRRRASILSSYVTCLLDDWDRSRGIRREELHSDPRDTFNTLCEISYGIASRGQTRFTHKDIQKLNPGGGRNPEELVGAICRTSGLLREIDGGWEFAHRAFLEYFAAEYCVRSTRDTYALLAGSLAAADDAWPDILIMTACLTPDASDLVIGMCEKFSDRARGARLVCASLTRDARVSPEARAKASAYVAEVLIQLLQRFTAGHEAELARGRSGHGRPPLSREERSLVDEMSLSWQHPFIRAVRGRLRTIADSKTAQALEALERSAREERST